MNHPKAPEGSLLKHALSAKMTRRVFPQGSVIPSQGEILHSLLIIRMGVVLVERDAAEVMRLSPGDWLSGAACLSAPMKRGPAKLTMVVAYELAREDVANIVQERPSLAEEFGTALSRRVEYERRSIPPHVETQSITLTARIRQLFNIAHFTPDGD